MKVRFKGLAVGTCFFQGANPEMKKKVGERKASVVKDNGRVSTRKVKGDPEVEPTICELRYLGVGLRRHPDLVVEIGDGDIRKARHGR
jgi:hypothetical protein